ncbi:Transcriptional regulatory protein, C terminal [Sphingomonas laterariae]|uniref:Transcriptional regulatory protein, C terminal n=1 Tax=Edaphosphingomonas laterariae TaxID=861865 RepID=A0A239C7U6_9SPHN|nr:tetratricopeptide repeat protein [Sphingomonas laterariae]SNS16296.1 Transcriptional regulatory protein, C terminal [Sphingomonas laterariae]
MAAADHPAAPEPIDLAHRGTFHIGAAEIHPPTREVVTGARREVIEPRVMQVLVALADAGGQVVSRHDLAAMCWENRVVGDDAVNRVMSRLRALGRETEAFRVETITKVGYRLLPTSTQAPSSVTKGRAIDRRALIGGGGLALLALGGGLWLASKPFDDESVRALLDRGRQSARGHRAANIEAAIRLYRQAIERQPDNAEAWGLLALAYRWQWESGPPDEAEAAAAHTRDAADRALVLDAGNADAEAARVGLIPLFRNWRNAEQACRAALARHPTQPFLLYRLTRMLLDTGQLGAALPVSGQMVAADPMDPLQLRYRVLALWANGRLQEAGEMCVQAVQRWPRHYIGWFTNLYFLAYTGQTKAALAFIADRTGRPPGVADWNYDLVATAIRALDTRTPTAIDAAIAAYRAVIPTGSGFAENAIVLSAALGRLDDAFHIADAYYFGRGIAISERRYGAESAEYQAPTNRSCHFLFTAPTAPMRADPRFDALTRAVGLDDYWRQVGRRPDHLSST